MDVVIRTAHGEAEITITRVGEATALADIVERVTGSASPPTADVDGRPVLTTATIADSGIITGSVIDLGPPTRAAPQDTVLELVQVAGWGAGARQALGPGVYRIGPGRRINAADLEIAHVDKIAFEISIASDGAASVTVDEQAARIDGIGVKGSAPWATGILDVGGRAFELDRTIGRTDAPMRQTAPGTVRQRFCSTVRHDRRGLPTCRRSPYQTAWIDGCTGAPVSPRPSPHDGRRPVRPARARHVPRRGRGTAQCGARSAPRAVPPRRRSSPAGGATSPRLWSARPGRRRGVRVRDRPR